MIVADLSDPRERDHLGENPLRPSFPKADGYSKLRSLRIHSKDRPSNELGITVPIYAVQVWENAVRSKSRRVLERLDSPAAIQAFVDALEYSCEDSYRCPLRVLNERIGHCFDGAVFAAAALRRIGQPAMLLDMLPNGRDDDHVLALFRQNKHWGAIAKSNFVGLRFREPVYRSVRELIMSYFEHYFNAAREKTLAGYTRPLNLAPYDNVPWTIEDAPLDQIADHLDRIPRYSILNSKMAKELLPVDTLTFRAGMLVAKKSGLYRVT